MTSENIFLVGNPNAGKTTFFNLLTQSYEHTGNWHGVTVDAKQKMIKKEGKEFNIIDLPGIYSLTSFSFEEQVSIDYLLSKTGKIINICDGNILPRSLFLTLELIECGFLPTLFVNFDDEIVQKGIKYDYKKLSNILGINVVANTYKKTDEIKEDFFGGKFDEKKSSTTLPYIKELPISEVLSVLTKEQKEKIKGRENFFAIKILEDDEKIKSILSPFQQEKIERIKGKKDYSSYICSLRFGYIDYIISQIKKSKENRVYGKFLIDKILLNKFFAFPIFLGIITLIFYITFSSFGSYLSNCLKGILDMLIGRPINAFLIKINSPTWIVGLFSGGIMEGAFSLVSFIPQVVLLFFFLSVLEDSGYISRLSFCFEETLSRFGLSGKSIFTLIMSFGCTTSAVLSARTLEDKNTKIKTIMASSFMSCSAKIPIYAVIGGAFFGKGNILVIVSLYALGVILSLILSSLLSKGVLKSGEKSFIMEFPPYRMPSLRRVGSVIFQNCKAFLVKVSTILLSFSVIVWILQNFSLKFAYIPQNVGEKSILEEIGNLLAPLFAPIGLGSWGIVVSLLVGIMAKEMIVSSIAIINKVPSGADLNAKLGASFVSSAFVINFSQTTALVMMVFSLLYCPCISTIASMKKEMGTKWTIFLIAVQFSIAYGVCFVLYNFLIGGTLAQILMSLGLVLLLILLFVHLYNKNKDSKIPFSCQSCHKCL